MKPTSVAEALLAIPGLRNELEQKDDVLRAAIKRTEEALTMLRPGIPTYVGYMSSLPEMTQVGHWLAFEKLHGTWVITWSDQDDVPEEYIVPLLSAPRQVRAEAFTPMAAYKGLAPIEQLIIEVVDTLSKAGASRSPMLEVADRLVRAFDEAGLKRAP